MPNKVESIELTTGTNTEWGDNVIDNIKKHTKFHPNWLYTNNVSCVCLVKEIVYMENSKNNQAHLQVSSDF